jgi:hypothetical protein
LEVERRLIENFFLLLSLEGQFERIYKVNTAFLTGIERLFDDLESPDLFGRNLESLGGLALESGFLFLQG